MDQVYLQLIQHLPKDFTLIDASSKMYSISKTLICHVSPILEKMCQSNMTEARKSVLLIEDFPPSAVENMVNYMYGDTLTHELSVDLFLLAQILDKYQIPLDRVNKHILDRIKAFNLADYMKWYYEFPTDNRCLLDSMLDLWCAFQKHNQRVQTLKWCYQENKEMFKHPAEFMLASKKLMFQLLEFHDTYAKTPLIQDPSTTKLEFSSRFKGPWDFLSLGFMDSADLLRHLDLLYLESPNLEQMGSQLDSLSQSYLVRKMTSVVQKEPAMVENPLHTYQDDIVTLLRREMNSL
jgi:hypothetical protein